MIHSKRNLENKKILYGYLIAILVILVFVFIYHNELKLIYSNPEKVKQFIAGFGIFAPIVLILLQTFQVVIFVIPGPVFTIAGGYTFGIALGTIYSLIGTLLGSTLVFSLSKKFGRPFVVKIVNKKELGHFDAFFKSKGKLALFVSRLIPILFPNDVVSFAAGITSLNLKDYFIISLLGFIPNILILSFFGDQLSYNMNPLILLFLSIVGFGILIYLFRHPIKIFFIKEIKDFEREMELIEEKSLNEVKIIEKNILYDYKKMKNEVGLVEKIIFHKKETTK